MQSRAAIRYFPENGTSIAGLHRLTRLAADLIGVPIAAVSLVGPEQIRFICQAGVELPDYPFQEGFCGTCAARKTLWTVADAATDPVTAQHGHVTNHAIRFYCGAPIFTREGECIGAMAVMDRSPRQLVPRETQLLASLAQLAMEALEEHRSFREVHKSYQIELVQREIREDHIRGLM